ncbi:MAG: hypothetical protein LBP28_06880 [Coriobacteriales bacterium]|jgi:putative lysine transport system ATP-binding protein|nr:hypothetical protein [Coriobacteriales bacterium]
MAYVSTKLYIDQAAVAVRVELFFPTDLPEIGTDIRGVITLLHGASNSNLEWVNLTSAYRYASDKGYILVIPEAQNSFYHDMVYGAPFYTILTRWLPEQLDRIFKIPSDPALNYIAGLSMGGYGAMRIGLANPQRYRAIGAFSAPLEAHALAKDYPPETPLNYLTVPAFGTDRQVPPEADPLLLAEQVALLPAEQRPRLFTSCGLEDSEPYLILEQNRHFAEHLKQLPLDFRYLEWTGTHEWYFWDRSLAEFIGFIEDDDYARLIQAHWDTPGRLH